MIGQHILGDLGPARTGQRDQHPRHIPGIGLHDIDKRQRGIVRPRKLDRAVEGHVGKTVLGQDGQDALEALHGFPSGSRCGPRAAIADWSNRMFRLF
jgi:hypothetical protein